MKELKIYPCGILVFVTVGGFEGMITAAFIRFERVVYEIKYWFDGEHLTTVLGEEEFKPISQLEKKQIGFK